MTTADRPSPQPIAMRRVTSAAWSTIGIAALLALAARTTGAGWLVALLCLLAGALVVGLAWPRIALARVRPDADGPADTEAGRPTPISVRVANAGSGTLVRIGDGPWRATMSDDPIEVEFTPTRRGRVEVLDVEVASGAPFGMSWARRRRRTTLRHPLIVAPRTADADLSRPADAATDGDLRHDLSRHGGDEPRSVRDYVLGDAMRLVHWPATARRGELMVKEFEAPGRRRVHVTVELTGAAEADERACERAMGVIRAALTDGLAVSLGTSGPDGPSRCDVDGMRAAGRALAVAGPGRCPRPAHAGDAEVRIRSAQT